MDKSVPYAIIIGISHPTSLGICRSLGQHGIPVVGITLDDDTYLISKYYNKIINVAKSKLISFLLSNPHDIKTKPVLFAGSDVVIMMLDDNKDILQKYYHIMGSDKFSMKTLINKAAFYQIIKSHNSLHLPKTVFLVRDKDNNRFLQEISYPWIIKPTMPNIIKKSEYKIVSNRVESDIYINKIMNIANECLVQEYIAGPDSNNYEVFCHRSSKYDKTYFCIINKIRMYPPITGTSSYLKTIL